MPRRVCISRPLYTNAKKPSIRLRTYVILAQTANQLAISQSPGSCRANPMLEGREIWQHTFKLKVQCNKEIFHFLLSKKLIFDSRYFFTYLTPVTIYFVPPNDPRMHRDLFWEKADSKAKTVKIVLPCKNKVISRNHNLLFKIFKCILHERHCFANIS